MAEESRIKIKLKESNRFSGDPIEAVIINPDTVTILKDITRVRKGNGFTIYFNGNILSIELEGNIVVYYE